MGQMDMPNEPKKGFNVHLFKTALCKTFSTTGSCQYNDRCKFAHGPQDLHQPGSMRPNQQNFNGFRGGYQNGFGGQYPNMGGYGMNNGYPGYQQGNMGYNMNQGYGNNNLQRGPAGGVPQVCKFFSQSGTCKWGNGCKFTHQMM